MHTVETRAHRFVVSLVNAIALVAATGCASASNSYNAAPVTAATGNGGGIATASAGAVTMNATGGRPEVDPTVNGVGFGGGGANGASETNRASSAPGDEHATSRNGAVVRPTISPAMRERMAAANGTNGPTATR